MFSLESPHRGDSNEYTHYTIFKINKFTLNYLLFFSYANISKGLKVETAARVRASDVLLYLVSYGSCIAAHTVCVYSNSLTILIQLQVTFDLVLLPCPCGVLLPCP